MQILMCEPQCRGYEHSTFNAALLRTTQAAYPQAEIRFLGEEKHIAMVREALSRHGGEGRVIWQAITVPGRDDGNWQRLPSEQALVRGLLNNVRDLQADLLIVCSVTGMTLLALKTLIRLENFRVPTIAIPHSVLAGLLKRRSVRPLHWLANIRTMLNLPTPPALRLVALGGSIYELVVRLLPAQKEHWVFIDDPYLWPEWSQDYSGEPPGGTVRFGYFGTATRGFELFSRLADEVAPAYPHAEFHMVGFLPRGGAERYSRHIRGLGEEALSLEEFHRRARMLTYAVGTRDPDYYRLISSVTFIDALACLKPGIYLRNAYVEHYFEYLGDVGYLCDSYESLREVVVGILREFPRERYQQQLVNILKGRSLFDPEVAALRLRTIVDDCRASLGQRVKVDEL